MRGKVPTGTPPVKAETPSVLRFVDVDRKNAALFGTGGGLGTQGAGGNSLGAQIVTAARNYLGQPYVWGGDKPSEGGFDCSGLVTYVLVHDLGYRNLPDNDHTTTWGFLDWSGAQTIGRDQAGAGDLAVNGTHMGICIDNKQMIHAPTFGEVVKIGNIQSGMVIRRVKPK